MFRAGTLDMAGDQAGWKNVLWAPFVCLLFPGLLLVLIRLNKNAISIFKEVKRDGATSNSSNTSSRDNEPSSGATTFHTTNLSQKQNKLSKTARPHREYGDSSSDEDEESDSESQSEHLGSEAQVSEDSVSDRQQQPQQRESYSYFNTFTNLFTGADPRKSDLELVRNPLSRTPTITGGGGGAHNMV